MTIEKLQKVLAGQAGFRLKQAIKLVFLDLIDDWSQASVFPLDLREKLNQDCPLNIQAELFMSKEQNSGKAIIQLSDGLKIETALMAHKDGRNTICLSSQVGCPLACKFCATGKMGFSRNLDYSEILLQLIFWGRFLKNKKTKITNVVFMGMGEPLLNYDHVFKAIKFINDPDLFNISSRKIAISTVGLINEIKKLASEQIKVDLALSLHAPNDVLRRKIIPYSNNYQITQLLEASDFYIKKTKRKVMIEYLLIKNLNDGQGEALELARLLSNKKLYFLNLIKYNQTGSFKASDQKTIRDFKNILTKKGISVVERYRFNQDVFSACGQMALKKQPLT